jgi:hypothetical protein
MSRYGAPGILLAVLSTALRCGSTPTGAGEAGEKARRPVTPTDAGTQSDGGIRQQDASAVGDAAPLFGQAAVDGGPAWAGPTVSGTVTVDRSMTTGKLVPGFVGLSYEKSHCLGVLTVLASWQSWRLGSLGVLAIGTTSGGLRLPGGNRSPVG